MAGSLEPAQWPPRSPYEALLTSPNGRQRLSQQGRQLSPSPSPLKRSAAVPNLKASRQSLRVTAFPAMEDDEDEEEDEETLQLRLEALEAKLKLKRLRARKARAETSSDPETEKAPQLLSRTGSALSSRSQSALDGRVPAQAQFSSKLQVPLSPEKKKTENQPQQIRSPGRVLLGIDKGLSGRNVSLRKAPSSRYPASLDDPFSSDRQAHAPQRASASSEKATASSKARGPTFKSFNQRMADLREHEKEQEARQQRAQLLQRQRSTGFGTHQHELDSFKKASLETGFEKSRQPSLETRRDFTRDEVMRAFNRPNGGHVRKCNTTSGGEPSNKPDALSANFYPQSTSSSLPKPMSSNTQRDNSTEDREDQIHIPQPTSSSLPNTSSDSASFEPFSEIKLARRILPHTFLSRNLADKTPMTIPLLLRDVKAPDFSLPDSISEKDYVVFGIIASKSAPISHKDNHKVRTQDPKERTVSSLTEAAESEANVSGKYMVLTLTDLTWTLDLYLFTTAYTRFRKLTPGTLVAILNPNIMPPPRAKVHTGRWSLTLSSSDDTILEIGTAQDLGYCKATKKDGKVCGSWIDTRKTEFCEWHVDQNIERTRRGRMEVQGMSAPFAPGGKSNGRIGLFGPTGRKGKKEGENGLLSEGKQYDRSVHSTFYMAPSRSSVRLLDADMDSGRGSREERMRKTLAEREKELEIAKKLGQGGSGTGAEYLRVRIGGHAEKDSALLDRPVAIDAGSLGLLDTKSEHVHLSPIKRKHAESGKGTARKKTRFMTAKGIREAGRDSLSAAVEDPHASDELEIV